MLITITALVYFFIVLLCVIYIRKIKLVRLENQMLAMNIHQSELYFDEIQERIQAVRKYRHDLQKHILIVEQFLEESNDFREFEEYRDLCDYMEDMKGELDISLKKKFCDHELLNAICTVTDSECSKRHIRFETDIQNDDLSPIDDYHLTGIIMNLLDNAVEAQEKIRNTDDRRVVLSVQGEKEIVDLSVGNRIRKGDMISFISDKPDSASHGMGVRIVSEFAALYGGTLQTKYDRDENMLYMNLALRTDPSGKRG